MLSSRIGFNQSDEVVNPWQNVYSQNAMIFGKHTFVPIQMNKALNENTVVIGTSGTGKTYSFVEPNILQGNANYVIADAKGDILRDTGASLKKLGYQIQVLNLIDLKHSMTYNPLNYLENQMDYLHFADQTVSLDVTGKQSVKTSSQDPMWNISAGTLLQALLYFVKEFLPPEQQTMGNVNMLFSLVNQSSEKINEALSLLKHSKLKNHYYFDKDSGLFENDVEPNIGDLLFSWAASQNPDSEAVKMWNTIACGKNAERMWSSIIGILGAYLARYSLSDVENLMSSNQIDFSQLLKPKTALFILYDDSDSSKNFISNTLYTQLFSYLFRVSRKTANKLPVKVRFFLDDFSNMYIPDFPQKLATARSRNISICIMLQNEGQLDNMYGKNVAETIISNCKNYLLTGTTGLRQANLSVERFSFMSQQDVRCMQDHFLLDVAGHTTKTTLYDFHAHPNYVPEVFTVDQYFMTPDINVKDNSGLLNIVLSLPNLRKSGFSSLRNRSKTVFPFD